jgi:hypothetical protein
MIGFFNKEKVIHLSDKFLFLQYRSGNREMIFLIIGDTHIISGLEHDENNV